MPRGLYIYVCVYIYIYVYACIYMYVYIYVSIYVCVYDICMCIYMYAYVCVHIYIYVRGVRPAARPNAAEVRASTAARRLRSPAQLPGPPLGADSGGGAADEGRGREEGAPGGSSEGSERVWPGRRPPNSRSGAPRGGRRPLCEGKAPRPAVAVWREGRAASRRGGTVVRGAARRVVFVPCAPREQGHIGTAAGPGTAPALTPASQGRHVLC